MSLHGAILGFGPNISKSLQGISLGLAPCISKSELKGFESKK